MAEDNIKRHNTLAVSIADQIKGMIEIPEGTDFSEMERRLIETVAEREVKKQADALVQVYDKLRKLENDLKKIDRPDHILFGRDGKPNESLSGFTKGRKDEIGKLTQQITKHENAIEKALTKGEFNDVFQLASGKDPGGDSKGGDSKESEDGASS